MRLDDLGPPTATLEDVDIRSHLSTRPSRSPDYESEDRAFAALAREMAVNPRNMLQKLVETAVALCHAETAGISLLEGDVFRWEAVAGVFASYRNGTMPLSASPCGVCIDQNATQLMSLPDRLFPALRAEPRFVEALLIPFEVRDMPVGTVWIVSHTGDRGFDREDERVVRALSHFASAALQSWKAREVVEQANRRKDEFLAVLGHELRSPLAAILSATQALQTTGLSESNATHALEMVARQSQYLTRMVNDLLDLSRINTGKLQLSTATIAVGGAVADAVESTRPQIERRGQDLSVELPSEPIWVVADAVRLGQLLTNLLDNASKYTPMGGRIWITATPSEGLVEITVRDTGIGMSVAQLPTVFDLFTQLESGSEGLALGLSLVRNLTELHGGSVSAASGGAGQGSQFTVRLPTSDPPQAVTESPSQAAGTARTRRILVVEDNEDAAESLAMTLRLAHHEVSIARNGFAALAALSDFRPDVVLLDVGLPDMDGYQVARMMRKHPQAEGLTIFALSGYGQDRDRVQSKEAGCDGHLVKPVNPDVLQRTLNQSLR